tara:strand:- start:2339 stop:3265 length:927 start_codon:yes stop_codon:yes gene_type:complete
MSLIVLKPGLQSTIQDLGRYNYSHFGISASGAADPLSLKIGNLIVGNKESASAIEMTIIGGEFQFDSECYIAISGSEFEASLDNNYITNQKAIDVKKGQILSFGQAKTGARAYLCIQGGIDVDNYLSSKSTHILSGIGGYLGQPISKGDILSFGINKNSIKPIIFRQLLDMNTSKIRVISGLQNDFFDDKAWSSFISNPFTVSNSSNRMGIRLDGNKILSNIESEIITEGVPLGAIQVPGSGDPIISFVEHQTTGGYPKIANVIIADIHKVGQLKPGDKFQFNLVSKEEAEELRLEQMSFIKNLKNND